MGCVAHRYESGLFWDLNRSSFQGVLLGELELQGDNLLAWPARFIPCTGWLAPGARQLIQFMARRGAGLVLA